MVKIVKCKIVGMFRVTKGAMLYLVEADQMTSTDKFLASGCRCGNLWVGSNDLAQLGPVADRWCIGSEVDCMVIDYRYYLAPNVGSGKAAAR